MTLARPRPAVNTGASLFPMIQAMPPELLSSAILLVPALLWSEPVPLEQLHEAAELSQVSVEAPSPEGAAAANQVWAEDGGGVAALSAGRQASVGAYGDESLPPVSQPKSAAKRPQPPPKAESPPDPLPPKITGWEGFKMGFLGTEAQALRLLGKTTGPLAVPLLILLQPIIALIGLVAGILGCFGVRL
jgi:hypothetical protein